MAKKKPEPQEGKSAAKPDQSAVAGADKSNQTAGKSGSMAKSNTAPKSSQTTARPNPIKRFIQYVEASRAELRKVTWPTAKETRKATIAVLSFVALMAVVLGLIDLGLSSLIKTILS